MSARSLRFLQISGYRLVDGDFHPTFILLVKTPGSGRLPSSIATDTATRRRSSGSAEATTGFSFRSKADPNLTRKAGEAGERGGSPTRGSDCRSTDSSGR